MKKHNIIRSFIVLLIIAQSSFSQRIDFICEDEGPILYRSVDDRGGVYAPSEGTINTLVIFVQLRDDWNSTEGWPTNIDDKIMSLPQWAHDFAGPGKGLTQYFEEMSGGRLVLDATIYPELVNYKQQDSRLYIFT